MKRALLVLGLPLALALGCSDDVKTRRVTETTITEPRVSERTVILNEPHTTTTHERTTEVYEEDD